MLIDANTGEYINAAVKGCEVDILAVDGVEADGFGAADVYDLSGRVVMRGASVAELKSLDKGIYIRAGKKYVVR